MENRPAMIPLENSARDPIPRSTYIGAADPAQELEITVVVKRRRQCPSPSPASERGTRSSFAHEYGAAPVALNAVLGFSRASGLKLVEVDRGRRVVRMRGTVGRMSRAFGVSLARFKSPDGVFRGRTGPVHVPSALADAVESIFGLDNRPAAWPRFRPRSDETSRVMRNPDFHSFTAAQIARLYGFSPQLTAAGQRIAIIELGGGFSRADVSQYFARIGLEPPDLSVVSIGGGRNQMGIDHKADGEVALDIQVAAAAAPGASIVIYFAADSSEQSYIDVFSAAVHDSVNRPTVISLSWGGPEAYCTRSFLMQFDQIVQEAAHLGITVCAASGDDGSYDLPADQRDATLNLVDFPAASPCVLACGGTRLLYREGRFRETVWNNLDNRAGGASGGGISSFFRRPTYQDGIQMPVATQASMRGVPDVAGNADPLTGYLLCVNGSFTVGGGTSAVAPLWAALIARLNAALGRQLGFVNPLLYSALARETFRDITRGSNGGFRAQIGWDACTGLGTPRYAHLSTALGSIMRSHLAKASISAEGFSASV